MWLWLWLAGCDAGWEEPVRAYRVLVCRYEAVCAESTLGLDCEAYEDQLKVKPDPCVNYDDYYMEACLTQMRELVQGVEEDPRTCPEDREEGAPACGQAMVRVGGCR